MSLRHVAAALILCATVLAPLVGRAHNCSITASPLDFGSYDSESLTHHDVTGTIRARCSAQVPFAILQLSPGSSGDAMNREMISMNGVLAYNLYTDPSRTQVWGDGSGGSAVIRRVPARGQRRWSIPVYGRIAAGQNPWPGSYADNIVVTIIF
jgi:spore coat protein U-like protein